jgi:hypothetical protein
MAGGGVCSRPSRMLGHALARKQDATTTRLLSGSGVADTGLCASLVRHADNTRIPCPMTALDPLRHSKARGTYIRVCPALEERATHTDL